MSYMKYNNNNLIYHIYWGTAGNAGLYIDEIYQSLNKAGYRQKVFVSYYYPFDYGEKVFFKRTEMEHCRYKGLRRKIMQAFELLYSLCLILWKATIDKPGIVNYSYVSSGNILILSFLKLLKKFSACKLVITCHDVVPFARDEKEYNKELAIKRKIFAKSDYYLIHNQRSKDDLQRLFCISDDQILSHPFPLMDLSKLEQDTSSDAPIYDFLFIGQMRKEKGLNLLLEAWREFIKVYPNAKLCVAGNPLYYKEYLEEEKKWCENNNVTLNLGFVKDSDYAKTVKSARCVVFPYTAGTNSGVISTVVSLDRNIITSDIAMFSENPFVPKENMFLAGDSNALSKKMIEFYEGKLKSGVEQRIISFKADFEEKVKMVYASI